MRIGARHIVLAVSFLVATPVAAGGPWSGRDDAQRDQFTPDSGGTLDVSVDMARVVSFQNPAATIIVGNDDIVEATLIDDQSVVLTGRIPGRTNLLVLDADRRPIFDRTIEVTTERPRVITVRRGGSLEILLCVPEVGCSEGDLAGAPVPGEGAVTPQADRP